MLKDFLHKFQIFYPRQYLKTLRYRINPLKYKFNSKHCLFIKYPLRKRVGVRSSILRIEFQTPARYLSKRMNWIVRRSRSYRLYNFPLKIILVAISLWSQKLLAVSTCCKLRNVTLYYKVCSSNSSNIISGMCGFLDRVPTYPSLCEEN